MTCTYRRRHGFPARAIFPGWYVMDSVKWVRRIVVLSTGDRQSSFYQSGMDRVYNRVVQTVRVKASSGFQLFRSSP
jgi:DMSO/TMAO reductase YedYZ molybdopterin-dependent catalytic subunit